MRLAKTKRDFRPKIFLIFTKIAFENNALLKINIILVNFKFDFRTNLGKILGKF